MRVSPNQIVMRRCQHQREGGMQCAANCRTGSDYCFFHDPAVADQRAAARRAGGIARTRRALPGTELAVRPLATASDVVELLGETINQVRRGGIDLRASNAIGYLSGILLSAIEKSSYEERLAALEEIVAHPALTVDSISEHPKFEFVESTTGPTSPSD